MSDFWNGRRVLVTGHTGFKGGWLALWLAELGARVRGFALAPEAQPSPYPDSQPGLYEAARVGERVDSVLGDVRDRDALAAAVAGFAPEIVFHLAAQSLVRRSFAAPVETFATNVMGTVHLLEALRAWRGPVAVVIVSSDKCYANPETGAALRESDPLGGKDPYSASKAGAELVAASYRASFFDPERLAEHGIAVASARAGNVIGGGDRARDRLVPDLVRAWTRGDEAVLRNPGSRRPWQHVLDPLDGYLRLARLLSEGRADLATGWNFGPLPRASCTTQQLVELAAAHWGPDAGWRVERDPKAPSEARLLALDSSRARDELGWTPRDSLDTAVGHTLAWYRAQLAGKDMQAFTLREIRERSGFLKRTRTTATAPARIARARNEGVRHGHAD